MARNKTDQERELRERYRQYVHDNMHKAPSKRHTWRGFWYKTLPFVLGTRSKPRLRRVLVLLLRGIMLVGLAGVPVLTRRLLAGQQISADHTAQVLSAMTHLDKLDVLLIAAGVVFKAVVEICDFFSREHAPQDGPRSPYFYLTAAINKFPSQSVRLTDERRRIPSADDAIRLALEGLREELGHLIGDVKNKDLVDITFLEYCDADGKQMHVRVRTEVQLEVLRPINSSEMMAHYVATEGRWFAEHDMLSKSNPFPKRRLSLQGHPPITYRSVLFLPIYHTEVKVNDAVTTGGGEPSAKLGIDYCIGVICAHSALPYRFWRWGDQSKTMGGFGNVAYERSQPYINLVRRLIEHSSQKVALERNA